MNTLLELPGIDYIWFCLLAVWGGTVNYISNMRRQKKTFSITELFGDWAISSFSGIMAAYVCKELGVSPFVQYATAGLVGHQGARTIALMERWMRDRFFPQQYRRRKDDYPPE